MTGLSPKHQSAMKNSFSSKFGGKRLVITGGLGFIGSSLAHRLVTLGAHVTLVDSLMPQYGGNLFNIEGIGASVKVNISDVRDEYSLRYLIQGQDLLFNLAGQTSHMDSMTDPYADLDINCRAQLSVLEACRKFNPDIKVVFASTRQVYGKPDYLPVDEKHLVRPVDVNGVNKVAGEQFHILYNNVYGIRACALRLTNTIGPRMRVKDTRQTFLGVWVRHLIEGTPFEVWGGEQLRDFTYIDDAVDAFLMAASSEDSNGHIFNVGGDQPITLKDLADLLIEVHGKGRYTRHEFPADRARIDIGDYYSNYQLIQDTLGWSPKVSLRQALTETLNYYTQHLPQYL